jgi:hypothetical protein
VPHRVRESISAELDTLLLYLNTTLLSEYYANNLLFFFLTQNIIFDCLKPIYNFLRAFGVFPQSRREHSDEFKFLVLSRAMAYSFCIFVVLMVSETVKVRCVGDVVSVNFTQTADDDKKSKFSELVKLKI